MPKWGKMSPFHFFDSKMSVSLADSASMNIIMGLWFIACISIVFTICYFIWKKRRHSEFSFLTYWLTWFLLTGFFMLVVINLDTSFNILYLWKNIPIILLWPLFLFFSPVAWYLRGSEGSSIPLEVTDYWLFILFTLIPQYISLAFVSILGCLLDMRRSKDNPTDEFTE